MNRFSPIRDVTAKQRQGGPGAGDTRKLWLCGHQAHAGTRRGGVLLRCAACQAARVGVAP